MTSKQPDGFSKPLPAPKLGMVMDGLFGSKLAYGITVWGRVWNIPGNTDDEVRSPSLTKDDIKRLQVLQNKCLRILMMVYYCVDGVLLYRRFDSV